MGSEMCIRDRFVVVDNAIDPYLCNVYTQSKIKCPDVDCQICALLMHGVPVMVLAATVTHDMIKCIALALGIYQCTVMKRSCNQSNVYYEVQTMQSFAEEAFEK